MSVATAKARISPRRAPSTTAVPRAVRSAQVPTGYAAFSTFAPRTISPDFKSREAPTLNLEYGPGRKGISIECTFKDLIRFQKTPCGKGKNNMHA